MEALLRERSLVGQVLKLAFFEGVKRMTTRWSTGWPIISSVIFLTLVGLGIFVYREALPMIFGSIFLAVMGLGIALFITRSGILVKILWAIAGLSISLTTLILFLKFTPLDKWLEISNPVEFPATDMAVAFGLISTFALLLTGLYGLFYYVPNFLSTQRRLLGGQERLVNGHEEMLKFLKELLQKFPRP